jgi:aryl-alcohol dehydrogenase-like predicted oxidoreductase
LARSLKIRHIGLSNVSVDELRRARRIVPIVSVQNRYNFSDRASEDVLAVCEKEGIAFLPWYPLAAGGHTSAGGALARVGAATARPQSKSRSPGCLPARP